MFFFKRFSLSFPSCSFAFRASESFSFRWAHFWVKIWESLSKLSKAYSKTFLSETSRSLSNSVTSYFFYPSIRHRLVKCSSSFFLWWWFCVIPCGHHCFLLWIIFLEVLFKDWIVIFYVTKFAAFKAFDLSGTFPLVEVPHRAKSSWSFSSSKKSLYIFG